MASNVPLIWYISQEVDYDVGNTVVKLKSALVPHERSCTRKKPIKASNRIQTSCKNWKQGNRIRNEMVHQELDISSFNQKSANTEIKRMRDDTLSKPKQVFFLQNNGKETFWKTAVKMA